MSNFIKFLFRACFFALQIILKQMANGITLSIRDDMIFVPRQARGLMKESLKDNLLRFPSSIHSITS